MNDGCRPASTSTRASIDEVVVLPWVPATATVRRVAVMAASMSARLYRAMPRSAAACSSGLVAGMAVEKVTASTAPTLSARWPTVTCTPASRRRSIDDDALRSLPVTVWPMAASTEAMALMPAPPMPTTWMRCGRDRSSAGASAIRRPCGRC